MEKEHDIKKAYYNDEVYAVVIDGVKVLTADICMDEMLRRSKRIQTAKRIALFAAVIAPISLILNLIVLKIMLG